jgi:hypothetical protein
VRGADLGWARITHPFHPLRGQAFRILKTRKVATQDTLILQGTNAGTFAVPSDWTDRADPAVFSGRELPAPILSFPHLLELVRLLAGMGGGEDVRGGLTDA